MSGDGEALLRKPWKRSGSERHRIDRNGKGRAGRRCAAIRTAMAKISAATRGHGSETILDEMNRNGKALTGVEW